MKIEVLYPEFCNLFGDSANIRYLKACLPQAEFINTPLNGKPYFLDNDDVSLVYMGPMSENTQEKVINRLMPFRGKLKEKIDTGLPFLFTGNALEVLGEYIEEDNGNKIPALGIFEFYAKRNMFERHNSECMAEFEGMTIMGFKSQFTTCYPKSDNHSLFTIKKGMGMNMNTKSEGIRVNNFMGTYFIGPILILNPNFTEYLLKLIGAENIEIAFKKESYDAYNKRLEDFIKNVPNEPEKYKYM